MHDQYQVTYENLREQNKKVLNFSSLFAEQIWKQKEVIEEIKTFENEVVKMNQSLYLVIKRPYGLLTAYIMSKGQKIKPFRLT